MALSITNKDAERLAREVAKETGESLTQAILRSLEERLKRLTTGRVAAITTRDILEIGARCAASPDLDTRNVDEILGYGDEGAPR